MLLLRETEAKVRHVVDDRRCVRKICVAAGAGGVALLGPLDNVIRATALFHVVPMISADNRGLYV